MREMKEPLSEIRESEDAQPGDGGSGGHLLRDISNEMAGLFKQQFGRPVRAYTSAIDTRADPVCGGVRLRARRRRPPAGRIGRLR
jgi:hypothetical protein